MNVLLIQMDAKIAHFGTRGYKGPDFRYATESGIFNFARFQTATDEKYAIIE